jgi:RNA polymerase sigma factor (sigma-70 family)
MHEKSDAQLLREYAEHGNEAAFREIVVRHTDLVYSSALRQATSPDLARDVAQSVFTDLARKAQPLARTLDESASLLGWLYRSTRFAALNQLRDDRRRQARERQAMQNSDPTSETIPEWDRVRPALDEAMTDLSDDDRDALLLRFFKNQDFRAIGQSLGVSDDAAQKRVSRALEKLRAEFARRGVTTTAVALSTALSANAITIAPAGLAGALSSTALAGTTLATTATATAIKTIAMTTLQKTLITATIAAAVGTGIYEARQASTLRSQVQTLQQQQAPLAEQLTGLKTENERLSNLVAQAKDSQALSQAQFSELLKLRGKANLAQTDSRELAQLKSTLAQQTGKMPDYLTNAMATGMGTAEKFMQKDALARLSRMKKMLNLTDDQEQAISDIMTSHIQRQSQMTQDLMTGKSTPEQQLALAGNKENQETEIKALFTPEQLAAYPEYIQAEKITAADNSAKNDASRIADNFSLSKEQQEQIRASFYQMNLNETANGLNQEAISAAKKSGNITDALNMSIELQKSQLEEKLKILGNILSPEQINTYRKEQMNQINMLADAMKMFLPQKPAGTTN